MGDIVYYVASSLDGYISGKDGDISAFMQEGEGVQKYLSDLANFDTVIMGRKTYEFGYKYGLEPGQAAYPHMQHHIFSNTLRFDKPSKNVHIESLSLDRIKEIRDNSRTDVYLCGGGQLAGWLLENGCVDKLKLKLNPIILGQGVRLFGDFTNPAEFKLTSRESFSDGLQILTYEILL
ncbi:MAG: dihydrofolate reductase family protein [Allomuricauda sp.]